MKISITKDELTIINQIIKDIPAKSFELTQESCGIGSTLDIILPVEIKGYHGEFIYSITSSATW